MCVRWRDGEREGVTALDRSFDGDGEEEGFWHERGQCVIMMSLGVYSETGRRRLLYHTTPKGRHYQLELSRDLSTGQTHRKWSCTRLCAHTARAHTHACTHARTYTHAHTPNKCTLTRMDTHSCMGVFLFSTTHNLSHGHPSYNKWTVLSGL